MKPHTEQREREREIPFPVLIIDCWVCHNECSCPSVLSCILLDSVHYHCTLYIHTHMGGYYSGGHWITVVWLTSVMSWSVCEAHPVLSPSPPLTELDAVFATGNTDRLNNKCISLHPCTHPLLVPLSFCLERRHLLSKLIQLVFPNKAIDREKSGSQ